MSSTNYDVELNLTYDDAHRHYIPTYRIAVPYFNYDTYVGHLEYTGDYSYSVELYAAFVSFDDNQEEDIQYKWRLYDAHGTSAYNKHSTQPFYSAEISATGLYSKVYFRNPHRDTVAFTSLNCFVQPIYSIKAAFEVQWNSVGFAANRNAFFKCSTVQKNTYKQYEWTAATVYYKKSTDSTYQSVIGTVSGSWSDVRIDTDISLSDGFTYDIYIVAISDDGTTAQTPVGQFTTTDATAIATCIAPSGAFTSGEVTFVWSHATEYGTPQYAYDLQYSNNNGSSWTTVANHVVTSSTTTTTTLTDAGVYLWRVRTYNSNDVGGEWAEATFVNQVPANPPSNLQITTKGRPTVSWASVSQTAYQVQFLLGDSVVYDSGAVYTSETSHFVNQYFDDTRSYLVRVRVYNALGEVSDWITSGYQQPLVTDVIFSVEASENGGATITITEDAEFVKYFILRNDKLIAQASTPTDGIITYTDVYANGLTNYSVVGVTSEDQSDIQTQGVRTLYPHATLIDPNGQLFTINKRVNNVYEIQTSNQADINKANFIGDNFPTHYPSRMRLKSFTINMFDEQGISESILGTLVYYADNFGNGGWCMVTAYDKTDNFVQNSQGVYANEVALTLEVTNYDDSIEYPI
jgi:hypothetical protein